MPSSPGAMASTATGPASAASSSGASGCRGAEVACRLGPRFICSRDSLRYSAPDSKTGRIVKYLMPASPDTSGP